MRSVWGVGVEDPNPLALVPTLEPVLNESLHKCRRALMYLYYSRSPFSTHSSVFSSTRVDR